MFVNCIMLLTNILTRKTCRLSVFSYKYMSTLFFCVPAEMAMAMLYWSSLIYDYKEVWHPVSILIMTAGPGSSAILHHVFCRWA